MFGVHTQVSYNKLGSLILKSAGAGGPRSPPKYKAPLLKSSYVHSALILFIDNSFLS